MKRCVALSLSCLVLAAAGCREPRPLSVWPEHFRLLPQPREAALLGGEGLQWTGLHTICLEEGQRRPVLPPLLSHLSTAPAEARTGVLTLSLSQDPALPESPEGYRLVVRGGGAAIHSRGEAGLFYGCQTLQQLLEDARDNGGKIVPSCRITDWPALKYRAVHIDVKHHLDTMKYYYDSIDRLARYKINAVIFEFEDKLRYRRRPEVGAPQSMSIDEMAALTRYARERHIEISPLVQGLGHATFILKHETYLPLREDPDSNWAFCPCDEGTYAVLFDLYRDAFDATPGSRYLHVGGDEIGEIGTCDRCRPMADEKGILALNLYWLNRVCAFARQNGRIPIFWDDMLFKYADLWATMHRDVPKDELEKRWAQGEPILDSVLEEYPKDCIYMRWNYTLARQGGNIRALDWFGRRGLKAWIATAAQNVHPLLPQEDRVVNIQSFIRLAHEKNIDGMLCTAWDDSSPHMETYWRGLIAAAEFSWSPVHRTLEAFEQAWLHREFGPDCTTAAGLYAELFKAVNFWNQALCSQGTRVNPRTLLDLPDPEEPGAWTRRHSERLSQAEAEVERYKRLDQGLRELQNLALRNLYHLELLAAINDFQVTSSRLLLALGLWDTEGSGAASLVREALQGFEKAWGELRQVYSITRFTAYPPDYVPDRYFHMASRTEDLEWMVEVERRLFPQVEALLDPAASR